MKMKSVDGQILYKKAKAKIFTPGNHQSFVKQLRAPAGKGLTAKGIDEWLGHLADAIEKQFVGHEYRLVPIGATSFNFVWVASNMVPDVSEAVSQSA